MATGLFDMVTPQQAQQAYLDQFTISPQQMGQQGLLQQVVSQMGNAGAGIGAGVGRLFGGMSPQEAEAQRVQGIMSGVDLSTVEGLKEGAQRFSKMGDGARAQALLDRALAMEKAAAMNAYYSERGSAGGGGTGNERMLAKISDVRRRLLQNKPVEPWEIQEAQDMIEILGKQKTYEDSNGNLVTISQAALGPLPVPKGQPTTTEGSAQPTTTQGNTQPTTTTTTQGARVTVTPEGIESRKKRLNAAETQLAGLNQTLANGKKIIDLYEEQGTGVFSTLNPLTVGLTEKFGGTKAKEAAVARKSIEADKIIDTLLRMKAESPTGSTGFGALNIEELNQVKAQFQLLDPQSPNYVEDVKTYLKEVERIRSKVEAIVKSMRGSTDNNTAPKPSYSDEDIIKKAMAANPNASREAVIKVLTAKKWLKEAP